MWAGSSNRHGWVLWTNRGKRSISSFMDRSRQLLPRMNVGPLLPDLVTFQRSKSGILCVWTFLSLKTSQIKCSWRPQVYCLNEAWGREDFNGMRMKWEQLWCVCDGKGIKGKKEALRACLWCFLKVFKKTERRTVFWNNFRILETVLLTWTTF